LEVDDFCTCDNLLFFIIVELLLHVVELVEVLHELGAGGILLFYYLDYLASPLPLRPFREVLA
jgi:hypothetical protein